MSVDKLPFVTEPLVTEVYKNLSEKIPSCDNGAAVSLLNISSSFNSSLTDEITGLDNAHLLSSDIRIENKIFKLNSSAEDKNAIVIGKDETRSAKVIQINKDVSSILFLHASAKEAVNDKAYDI